uniref:Conotoxin n=2 Tax=Haemonchus contortus TaxID=6289 RepID=A0A7I4YL62_HAECO
MLQLQMYLLALLLLTASVFASLNGGDRASHREVVSSLDQGSAVNDDLLLNDRPLLGKNDRMKRDRWTDQSIDDEYWPFF